VVRVGIAYIIICWALAQVAEFAVDNFNAPDWALQVFVVFLILGLPLVLFLAWVFELTPEGVKREKDIDRSQSITAKTGRKLDRIIIGVLAIAVALLLTDKFLLKEEPEIVAADPVVEDEGVAESPVNEIIATDQSIAVLPFVNMSDDKDYFADGLSEELLNLLAKIPELKVAGRTSSFAFKGKNDDLRAIGVALGVATVLEGSVRRSGDRLRVTAQLVKVDDGFHIWSETYDRRMADIFDIQDDVASAIIRELQIHLAPQAARPTPNAAAYALYLEALPHIAANDQEDTFDIVLDLLDRALALDPEFAKAHEARALAYWMSGGERIDGQTARQAMYDSANTALRIDPGLVVARMFTAIAGPDVQSWMEDFDAVEEALQAAPKDFNVLRAMCYDLLMGGYLQEALTCNARMVELEPLSSLSYWRSGIAFSALGRREEARASFQRAAALGGPLFLWDLAFDELVAGDYEAAMATLGKASESGASDWKAFYSWDSATLRKLVAGNADSLAGREFLRTWVRNTAAEVANFVEKNSVYSWYLAFGDLDEYWRVINDIGLRNKFMWTNTEYLLQYGIAFPESGFTRHPAYLEYARISGLTDVWDKRGPPDHCNKDSGKWVCE
jgi:TolB-like protein